MADNRPSFDNSTALNHSFFGVAYVCRSKLITVGLLCKVYLVSMVLEKKLQITISIYIHLLCCINHLHGVLQKIGETNRLEQELSRLEMDHQNTYKNT